MAAELRVPDGLPGKRGMTLTVLGCGESASPPSPLLPLTPPVRNPRHCHLVRYIVVLDRSLESLFPGLPCLGNCDSYY